MKNVKVDNIDMPDWLFKKIVQELSDIDYAGRVSLFEINEPLMDEDLVNKVKYVKEKVPKSWQFISTNGDLLTVNKTIELINAGLDYLTVNSYSYSSYKKIKALRKKLPNTILDHIVHTPHFSPNFAKDNRAGNLPKIQELKEPLKETCSRVNNVLYVKPDGKVVSCFGDFFSENIMGDAVCDNIVDIWFGESFSSLRNHLDKGNRSANNLCAKCNVRSEGAYLKVKERIETDVKRSNQPTGVIVGFSSSTKMFYPFLSRHSKVTHLISRSALKEESLKRYIDNKRVTENYSKILMDPTIDYVFVANQSKLHYETAIKALESGKHVLIEKPIVLSVEECKKLIQLGAELNLVVGGIFQWRFMNSVQIIKKILSEKGLGDILFINSKLLWKNDPTYYTNGRGTWDIDGGGVLIKQAIHCIDLLIYLFGRPLSWHAFGSNAINRQETEDTAIVIFKFENALGSLNATTASYENSVPEIEIIGTAGRVTFDFNDAFKVWDCNIPKPLLKMGDISILEKQVLNFFGAITEKESLVVNAEDCLTSLSIVLNIYSVDEFLKSANHKVAG